MKIAVDGIGSDYATEEFVRGAVIAAGEYKVDILLTGTESLLKIGQYLYEPVKNGERCCAGEIE